MPPRKRIDVRGIPEWAHKAAADWCELQHGMKLGPYLKSVIVQIAQAHVGGLTIKTDTVDIARYQKICRQEMGMTAEQRILNFVRNDLNRHS